MKKIGVALLFLMIALSSCVEMIKGAAKSITDSEQITTTESLSESAYFTVSVDSLYQLDVPNYMKQMNTLHPEASLQYANIYKEAYTVVIHENKHDFVDLFTELDEYNPDLSPIENYTIVQKKSFKESLDDLSSQDYGLVVINGYSARQVKMTGIIDGINVSYVISFIEGKDNIFMLMNWTTSDRFDRLENTFEFINGTFKLI